MMSMVVSCVSRVDESNGHPGLDLHLVRNRIRLDDERPRPVGGLLLSGPRVRTVHGSSAGREALGLCESGGSVGSAVGCRAARVTAVIASSKRPVVMGLKHIHVRLN